MVMKVLLPNRIRILDFVQATIWPKLIDNKLAVDTTVPYDSFLSLSEEHFVEVSSAWINECLEDPDRCYTDVIPRRIMSEGIPPLVEQFFRMGKGNARYSFSSSKVFLMMIGKNKLIFTLSNPIEVKIDCGFRKNEIRNISGRGVLQIEKTANCLPHILRRWFHHT